MRRRVIEARFVRARRDVFAVENRRWERRFKRRIGRDDHTDGVSSACVDWNCVEDDGDNRDAPAERCGILREHGAAGVERAAFASKRGV